MEQPITSPQTPDCDWLLHRFIQVNFSKLINEKKQKNSGMTLFAIIITSVKFQLRLMRE